jgi:hypothetical protein
MKNTFARILMGGVLAAGAMFAGTVTDVKVTLPHAVTVGSTTLPSGDYTISTMEMPAGAEYFVVRGAGMNPVVVTAQRADAANPSKTELTMSETDGKWHLDRLQIEGEPFAFEFEGK